MAEMFWCKSCVRYINGEIDVIRHVAGNIYCGCCNAEVEEDE